MLMGRLGKQGSTLRQERLHGPSGWAAFGSKQANMTWQTGKPGNLVAESDARSDRRANGPTFATGAWRRFRANGPTTVIGLSSQLGRQGMQEQDDWDGAPDRGSVQRPDHEMGTDWLEWKQQ